MINHLKRLTSFIIPAILLTFLFTSPAQAVYYASGAGVDLGKDKKLNETVFVSGNTLTVDAEINGDLFVLDKTL